MRRGPISMKTIALSWGKRALLACTLLLVTAEVASADTTYAYTGQAFNDYGCLRTGCGPVFPGSGPITLSFTESTPLPANLTGPIYGIMADLTLIGFTPTSFSISDGLYPFTGVSSATNFYVETGASGNIIAWNIGYTNGSYGEVTINSTGASPGEPVVVQDGAVSWCNPNYACQTVRFVSNSPGTWAVTGAAPVPEPSTIVLLGAGLAVLLILGVKRT